MKRTYATSTPTELGMDNAASKLLQQWRSYCHCQALLHNMSCGHFKVLNHALSITSMLLGSFSGLTVIGVASSSIGKPSAQTDDDYYYSIVIISMGVAGVLASTLASIHKFLGVAELQREHGLYSDMFENLMNDIDMHIVLDSNRSISRMFVNTGESLKYCKHRLNLLVDKAPPIPGTILRRTTEEKNGCDVRQYTKTLTVKQTPTNASSSHGQTHKPRRSISLPDVRRASSAAANPIRAKASLFS